MRLLQCVGIVSAATFLLTVSQSVAASSSDWQGPYPDQAKTAPSSQVEPNSAPQPSLPDRLQNKTKSHPQTRELPATQALPVPPGQPERMPAQSAPPVLPNFTAHQPPETGPVYLGLDGKTAPACRYPAGVRVIKTTAGSPADQAGLIGETQLSWKTLHTGRSSDLILAVDGKRVRNLEEFEGEMSRFRPGDLVYMSVLRNESRLRQVPVRLRAYPDNKSQHAIRVPSAN